MFEALSRQQIGVAARVASSHEVRRATLEDAYLSLVRQAEPTGATR